MDLHGYRRMRALLDEQAPRYRKLCLECRQPEFGCYCAHVEKFDPRLKFVILIHPIEAKRRIATGRMSHLCLRESELIEGQDYSNNSRVNEILENPAYQPLILYPGRQATNLSEMSASQRPSILNSDKIPVVFVIDGTWATAKKTMHLSQNLKQVPRVCFTPEQRSRFRVRKQPGVECYSTIEAIHHFIELLGDRKDFDLSTRVHDGLLRVFDKMVERQIEFVRDAYLNPRSTSYRRPRKLIAG